MASKNPRAQMSHIAGVHNTITDAGSRRSTSPVSANRFDILTSDWVQHNFTRSDNDLAFHLRVHSVSVTTYDQYLKALRKWHQWCDCHGIPPTLNACSPSSEIQHITDFIIRGFRDGYGSGHGHDHICHADRDSALLHGSRDRFPIRILLKGIHRIDAPSLCLAFFFLLLCSEITSKEGKSFAWFALKANAISTLESNGVPTTIARAAEAVHIRLSGSKTSQHGEPTLRALNRSGHQFLCPVFGALCLLRSRRFLPQDIPAAIYMTTPNPPACISATRMTNVIRRATARSRDDPNKFISHSLRTGGATHMYRAGVDSLTIQFYGRWPSDTFKQYTRLCGEVDQEFYVNKTK
ncbi:LOW QUALITY PROTEIN: hypothetical protein PHMEG_00034082 [Phytophthora megakarya]|uniref:Tyr recombinase domain-containing protein n=1 Tax=Phytophthora megakarya TaxID=4795 RepID=A0A225URQ8_9STRA|nr:LOW QUALITY PROTEIN: hypothetical protein PHMEG_00034082 [Phytophthora megakarya]